MTEREDIMESARSEATRTWVVETAVALLDEARAADYERIDQLSDALQQAVDWIEECGSDYDSRQFVLTEARAALKGLKIAKPVRTCATCHAVLADGPQPAATFSDVNER